MKDSAGVLESPVTVKQGLNVRIGLYGLVKGFENKQRIFGEILRIN